MTLYTAFTKSLVGQNEQNKLYVKLHSKIEQVGHLIEMIIILNSRRKNEQNLFDKKTVSVIRQELESLLNIVRGQINQNGPNQRLVMLISKINRYFNHLPIFDPHDLSNDLFLMFPDNYVSNKRMLENMFFDVKAIFDHAPKLFIEHYEDEPKCLPMDLIVVNAFG